GNARAVQPARHGHRTPTSRGALLARPGTGHCARPPTHDAAAADRKSIVRNGSKSHATSLCRRAAFKICQLAVWLVERISTNQMRSLFTVSTLGERETAMNTHTHQQERSQQMARLQDARRALTQANT